jgi:hypothetical protein
VVVLTNSDLLNPDVAVTIAHRAIGGKVEPLLRATHLEFNFKSDGEADHSTGPSPPGTSQSAS